MRPSSRKNRTGERGDGCADLPVRLFRVNKPVNKGLCDLEIKWLKACLDKGSDSFSPRERQELKRSGLELQTPWRSNMKDVRPKSWIRWLQKVRRRIETVTGQLAVRFNIEWVKARDMWHLTSRLNRKLLAHTVCCYLNRLAGRELLQFEALIPC